MLESVFCESVDIAWEASQRPVPVLVLAVAPVIRTSSCAIVVAEGVDEVARAGLDVALSMEAAKDSGDRNESQGNKAGKLHRADSREGRLEGEVVLMRS